MGRNNEKIKKIKSSENKKNFGKLVREIGLD